MVLITKCCCWNSVRRGSFASGIFTLAVYLVILTSAIFHVKSAADSPELLTLSIFMLMLSFCCVVSSVALLVGLCVDNRLFLLPWIASVTAMTLLDFGLAFYLIPDMIETPAVSILFVTDVLFCALNVYCIICVISQYQEYLSGRGRAGQRPNCQPIPTVRLQPDMSHSRNVPSVSYQISRNGTAAGFLAVPSPNSSSMTSKSPQPTDMSSISDEMSSNDNSRRSGGEELTNEPTLVGTQNRWKCTKKSPEKNKSSAIEDATNAAIEKEGNISITIKNPEQLGSPAQITIKVDTDDDDDRTAVIENQT